MSSSLLEVNTGEEELLECSKLMRFTKRMLHMVLGSEIDDRCRLLSGIVGVLARSKSSWGREKIDPIRHNRLKSNNFRWLNAVKETKIVFFVRDNSGEKFLTTHAAGRNFSEVICRACAVVVHSWFSHLHGKFCVLALRTFSVSSRGQPFPLSLIFHQASLRGASSIHTPSNHQRIRSSGCQWR